MFLELQCHGVLESYDHSLLKPQQKVNGLIFALAWSHQDEITNQRFGDGCSLGGTPNEGPPSKC